MNVDSILISEYARSAPDGRLTVVDTFNAIAVTKFPVRVPLIALSVLIHGHSAEAGTSHSGEIRFINHHREEIRDPIPFEFTFLDEPTPGIPVRHTLVQRIYGQEFSEPGSYAFEIYIDGTYHAIASLLVAAG